jgi:hypothetical protein
VRKCVYSNYNKVALCNMCDVHCKRCEGYLTKEECKERKEGET